MKGGVCLVNVVFMCMPATPRLVQLLVKWPVSYRLKYKVALQYYELETLLLMNNKQKTGEKFIIKFPNKNQKS